jgi:competence protein ComEA
MADSRVININVASEAELAQIAEIGIQHARKIIEYRAKHGRFKTIDELSKVPGIDKVILRDIRTSVTV